MVAGCVHPIHYTLLTMGNMFMKCNFCATSFLLLLLPIITLSGFMLRTNGCLLALRMCAYAKGRVYASFIVYMSPDSFQSVCTNTLIPNAYQEKKRFRQTNRFQNTFFSLSRFNGTISWMMKIRESDTNTQNGKVVVAMCTKIIAK